jgi:hypothetical protein
MKSDEARSASPECWSESFGSNVQDVPFAFPPLLVRSENAKVKVYGDLS